MNVWIQFIYFNPCFTQVLLSFLKIHLYKHKQGIFIILNHEKKKKIIPSEVYKQKALREI